MVLLHITFLPDNMGILSFAVSVAHPAAKMLKYWATAFASWYANRETVTSVTCQCDLFFLKLGLPSLIAKLHILISFEVLVLLTCFSVALKPRLQHDHQWIKLCHAEWIKVSQCPLSNDSP